MWQNITEARLSALLTFQGPVLKFEAISGDPARSLSDLDAFAAFDLQYADTHRKLKFFYPFAKRFFDLTVSILLLPAFLLVLVVLALVNPFLNKGPLFYVQTRMGKDCKPFRAIKFRSMTCADEITRGADDPLETHRITPLGQFLRRSRFDELPQIFNVFAGEMSLIGPRPDYYEHACVFVETVPGYRQRHSVLPGISGYAQTEVGYAAGQDAVRAKVAADHYYIANRGCRLDTWILWRTLCIVGGRSGA